MYSNHAQDVRSRLATSLRYSEKERPVFLLLGLPMREDWAYYGPRGRVNLEFDA